MKKWAVRILYAAWVLLTMTGWAESVQRPNVIVLYYDDMGYGDMGCNTEGSERSFTPNLDRFAAEGMRFTAGHSADGVCTPSRYAIMTGRYCWRTRLTRGVLGGYSSPLMQKDRFTIGRMFQDLGYFTAMVGKWHVGVQFLGPDGSPVNEGNNANVLEKDLIDFSRPLTQTPADHGFDYYFGTSASLDMPPYLWVENHSALVRGGVVTGDGTVDFSQGQPAGNTDLKEGKCPGGGRPGVYDPSFVPKDYLQIQAAKVRQVIQQQVRAEKPFFIYMPMPAPHTPWAVQDPFKGKAGFTYGDYLLQTDHYTGEILKALDDVDGDGNTRDSIRNRTVVFISSDNGPETSAFKTSKANGHDANGPFAGVKRDSWEGGTRVPFLVRWPGLVKANSRTDHPCWQGDFLATMAEYLGYDLGAEQAPDAESFLPVLQGGPMPEKRRPGFVEHSARGQLSIVDAAGKWKLIDGTGSGGNATTWNADNEELKDARGQNGGTPRQLFDLKADPGERNNRLLAPSEQALAKEQELLRLLEALGAR